MHYNKGMVKFLFNNGLMLEVLSNRKILSDMCSTGLYQEQEINSDLL
jgi:hypothetical protein